MSQQQKPVYDFGGMPATAPSTPRVDVVGWIFASVVLGLAFGTLALHLIWRPFPGLAVPPGALGFHAGQALRCLVHWLVPNLFVGEARAYGAFLSKLEPEAIHALIWRAGIGFWAFCMPCILLARSCLAPREGLIALRGSCRHEGWEAVVRLNAAMASGVKARPDHPIAPGVPYSAEMWTRHVLVVAGVGAGKSTALKPLIEVVVASKESLLLFDPKGEFTKGFGGPEILAPWDARSLAWDIAKDMRNIGDMRRFAATMIREAHDPMWSNAARQLLVGFMIYLKSTRGADWGWRQLADMMATPQANILPIMSAYHPEAVRAVERASVTTQGILINLASFSAPIFDLAEAWGETPADRRVSFVEWARQQGRHRQIILQGHGAYPDLAKSYLEGVLGTVSAIVNSVEMDDDESRKLWIIADEAGQMGRVPIRALIDVGRSRGVRCVLACQDLAQFEEIYGAHMVKALVSMVGTILVGQIMQGDTAEQMCKALGTREVERQNVSSSSNGAGQSGRSTTLSFSRDELAIYKPSELASRLGPTQDRKGVKLALFTGGNAYELFWPHYKMARARPAHEPAEWTRGFGPAVSDGGFGDGLGGGSGGDPIPGLNAGKDGVERRTSCGEAHGGEGVGTDTAMASPASREPDTAPAPLPPTAAEVQLLLRQSVDIHSVPDGSRLALASDALAAKRLHAGGNPPERGTASEPLALLEESMGEAAGAHVAHAVGGEAAALAIHAAELIDALRPGPGPIEVATVAQRAPSHDLDHPSKAKAEPKAKAAASPTPG